MTHGIGATNRSISTMKYDIHELLAEHSVRLEFWLTQTLIDIDENCPPLMCDFRVDRARMLGFLEAIELMCDEQDYQEAKQAYENMSDTIEKIIQRTEPKGIL